MKRETKKNEQLQYTVSLFVFSSYLFNAFDLQNNRICSLKAYVECYEAINGNNEGWGRCVCVKMDCGDRMCAYVCVMGTHVRLHKRDTVCFKGVCACVSMSMSVTGTLSIHVLWGPM